jgi:hypothetical protein
MTGKPRSRMPKPKAVRKRPSLMVRDMQVADERYVGCCSHVAESAEWDAVCARRIPWLRRMREEKGLRVKVALVGGRHAGFIYSYPIETCPWGPVGKDLTVVTCLVVEKHGLGLGGALLAAVEDEASSQGHKGVVVPAYYCEGMPFMPAAYFEKLGYRRVQRRTMKLGPIDEALLWKTFDASAAKPRLLESRYKFKPVPGKVVVDLFRTESCLTTCTESDRVRAVCAEFGDRVVLNEHDADDRSVLRKYEVWRGIFIDGREVGWGGAAPKEGIRKAINAALKRKR